MRTPATYYALRVGSNPVSGWPAGAWVREAEGFGFVGRRFETYFGVPQLTSRSDAEEALRYLQTTYGSRGVGFEMVPFRELSDVDQPG